jgi:hypothetical protein
MAAYEERCLYATTTEMSSGTARNAPKGPHIQEDEERIQSEAVSNDLGGNELPFHSCHEDPEDRRD